MIGGQLSGLTRGEEIRGLVIACFGICCTFAQKPLRGLSEGQNLALCLGCAKFTVGVSQANKELNLNG